MTLPLGEVVVTEEDVAAVVAVYRKGWLTMGPGAQAFEATFAEAVGVEHAVAVSSGTAALQLTLLAAGIGDGDEVIVSALSHVAVAAAVRATGATPVLADVVSAQDHGIDPAGVATRITARTQAVVATHRWGYPCDVAALEPLCEERGLLLVEDASEAVMAELPDGRRAGAAGRAGCFSFSAEKQLCLGEGGMVVTDDEELAKRARSLRSHAMTSVTWDRHRGHAESYDILDIGFNYRLDEPRAALALSRLPRLVAELEARRAMVRDYRAQLAGAPGLLVPWSDAEVQRSAHLAFGVLLEDAGARDAVRAELAGAQIQTATYPAVSTLTGYEGAALPLAEDVAARHVALPLSATYGGDAVVRVVGALRAALS